MPRTGALALLAAAGLLVCSGSITGCRRSKHAHVANYVPPPAPAGFAEHVDVGWHISVPATWKDAAQRGPAVWAVADPQAVDDLHAHVNVVTEPFAGDSYDYARANEAGLRREPRTTVENTREDIVDGDPTLIIEAHWNPTPPATVPFRTMQAMLASRGTGYVVTCGVSSTAFERYRSSCESNLAFVRCPALTRPVRRRHRLMGHAPEPRRSSRLHRVDRALSPCLRVALLVGLTGCAGLQLTPIKMTQQRPSNVAMYFKVQTQRGDPVSGLTAESFHIYEDGQLVSRFESKQTILNPEVAAVHYTMLLVDMSGSVSESGTGEAIVPAVGAFTEHIDKQQRVGVYAFDGSPELYPIVPFTDQPSTLRTGVQQLATFKPKDPSTNLNGAIVKALDELDNALGHASQPLKFGTLVVFTDGTDRANRVPESTMRQHIREKPFDVYAIGLGAEIKEPLLNGIGKSGTAMAGDKNAIIKAFGDMGVRVEARTRSYYLLSYCSPSRAGHHEVRIEAVLNENEGSSSAGHTGSLRSDFDATGFMPGCDPNAPPTFDVSKGDALAPVEKKEDKPEDKKEDKKEPKEKPRPPKPSPPRPPPPPAVAPPPPPPATAPTPPKPPPQDFNP